MVGGGKEGNAIRRWLYSFVLAIITQLLACLALLLIPATAAGGTDVLSVDLTHPVSRLPAEGTTIIHARPRRSTQLTSTLALTLIMDPGSSAAPAASEAPAPVPPSGSSAPAPLTASTSADYKVYKPSDWSHLHPPRTFRHNPFLVGH